GLPTEKVAAGELIAADPEADLAILKVSGVPKGAKPIDPLVAVAPSETLPVMICGVPFGDRLSADGGNPNITIGNASVSGLGGNAAGRLAAVQIDGSINPGNSGGPVIDSDGQLVGVAVATIKGSGIGMAVPAADLVAVLDGRVVSPMFAPRPTLNEMAGFR